MSIGDMSNFDYAVKMCRLTHGGNVPPFRCSRPPATPQAHPVPELQELLDDEELTIMPQEAEEQAEEEELRPFPFLNFQFCSCSSYGPHRVCFVCSARGRGAGGGRGAGEQGAEEQAEEEELARAAHSKEYRVYQLKLREFQERKEARQRRKRENEEKDEKDKKKKWRLIAVKEEEVDAKNTDAENEPVLDDANMMLLVD